MDARDLFGKVLARFEELFDGLDHRVICAAQAGSQVFYGMSINCSGQDICAEALAVGNALMSKSEPIECVVSIIGVPPEPFTPEIAPPCGNCRHLLSQYCPATLVVVGNRDGVLETVKARDLLPFPFVKPQYRTIGQMRGEHV